MSKFRILLTGGAGMVGRNFLDHPEIRNFDVLSPSSRELNLCDYYAVDAYVRTNHPDLIIHAAGKVGGIQANIREPVGYLMENLDMGRNIVWAARQSGVKRLINLGSSCMYPRGQSEPLREDQVLTGEFEQTNEGYALAKVVTVKLCEYIAREDDSFKYKTLIPCNLYGRYDKFDPVHSHLIPAIIHKVHQAQKNRQESVEIWGDGLARREFMYAGDFADAIMQAITRFDTLPNMMNIGLGYDYTINEYYQTAADVMGYRGAFEHNLSKPVGMARKLVGTDRQKRWMWSPQSSLRVGIEKTYQFYLSEYQ